MPKLKLQFDNRQEMLALAALVSVQPNMGKNGHNQTFYQFAEGLLYFKDAPSRGGFLYVNSPSYFGWDSGVVGSYPDLPSVRLSDPNLLDKVKTAGKFEPKVLWKLACGWNVWSSEDKESVTLVCDGHTPESARREAKLVTLSEIRAMLDKVEAFNGTRDEAL